MAKDQNSEAAKKVADAEKASKKKAVKDSNRPNVFVRAWDAIRKFFKNLKGENKKIIWPSGKMVLKSTGVVIVCVLIIGIGIWLVDFGLSKGVDAVLSIDTHATEEASTAEAQSVPEVANTTAATQVTTQATTAADVSAASAAN